MASRGRHRPALRRHRLAHATDATDRSCTVKPRPGLMPSRLIMEIKVVRFRPKRAAAPFRTADYTLRSQENLKDMRTPDLFESVTGADDFGV